MRSERPSMRYMDYERGRRNTQLTLAGVVVLALILGWVFVPTVVLALLGLTAIGCGIALSLKLHDLKLQRRANDVAQAIDRRLERERWVVDAEHETEVVPLGSDPNHCDDCRITKRRREQASIHELATTLGEECECDVCTNKPWRLTGACLHPVTHRIAAYDVRNEDNVIVHVDSFCKACGYTIPDDEDDDNDDDDDDGDGYYDPDYD